MRQYCSGGSRIWSSIHPLPGVCSSGWFRKNTNRPPGSSTRATSAMAVVDGVDVLEDQAGDHGVEGAVGERQRVGRRPGRRPGHRPARRPRRSGRPVGSSPTTVGRAGRGEPRATWPSPVPDVEHPPAAADVLDGQREDLLLVLGVDAVGEVRPATTRTCFPGAVEHQVVGHRRRSRRWSSPVGAVGHASPSRTRSDPRDSGWVSASAPAGRGSCRRRPGRPRRAATGSAWSVLERRLLHRADAAQLLDAGASCGSAPRPGMSSSTDVVMRLSRSSRWNVMAKRCASSRIRCSR